MTRTLPRPALSLRFAVWCELAHRYRVTGAVVTRMRTVATFPTRAEALAFAAARPTGEVRAGKRYECWAARYWVAPELRPPGGATREG